jgi:sulfur-oxidizing protein SoxZ
MGDTKNPLRVRVFADPAGGHELRLQLDHPSESGLRRGADGAPIPALYLAQLDILLEGQTALSLSLGPALADNPLFSVFLPQSRTGEQLEIRWRNNQGMHGSHQLRI